METKNTFIPNDTVERELAESLRKYFGTKIQIPSTTLSVKTLSVKLRKLLDEKLVQFLGVCIKDNRIEPIEQIIKIISQNLT